MAAPQHGPSFTPGMHHQPFKQPLVFGVGWGEGERERKKLVARGLAAPTGGGNGEGESENKRGPGVNAHTALNNRNLSPHTVSRSKGSPFSWPNRVQAASESFLANSGTCLKLSFFWRFLPVTHQPAFSSACKTPHIAFPLQ